MLSRRSITVLVLNCLLANILPLTALAQRRPPVRPPAANTSPAAKFDQDTVEQMESKDTGNNFAAKGLPAPAEFGGPPTDGMAAAIAKQISNYDRDKLPLLITTLQRAGFYIIDTQQKVLYQPTTGTGTGLAFYDFEVAGMYKLSRRGAYSSVAKMAGIIGKDTPELPPATIAATMLKDLRSAYNSSNRLVRFWAHLIVEFGRSAEAPVDLITASPEQAMLNVIQASLWERRLIGDMVVVAQKASVGKLGRPLGVAPVSFRPASYSFVSTPMYGTAGPPCQTGNIEGLVLDGSALGITTAHGEFMKLVESTLTTGKETFGKVATALGIVNMVLAWAKLVAAVMTLKGEIKIADPMPLVRTKNSIPGEYRMMTGKVWAEVGNLQVLNCVRVALNTASGLDFNVPSDGPLGDRDIGWYLTGDSSFYGQGSSQTGKFDNFVNLEAPDNVAERNPQKQISDENGVSKMNLVGGPKIPAVFNKPVVQIRKRASVTFSVALKSPRDKAQNALDIGGGALGIALSGPVAIISLLPEIGFRMPLTPARITVPVKDWQLCTSDWAGTISTSYKLKKVEAVKTFSRTGTRRTDFSTEADFVLNPRHRDVAEAIPPPKPADVRIKIDNTDVFEGTGEADVCCSLQSSKDPKARIREAEEFHSDRQTQSHVAIDLSERLMLSIRPGSFGPDAFKGIMHRSFTVSESSCPVDEDKDSEETLETDGYGFIASLDESKTGRRLLNQGESVEELYGRESYRDAATGADIVIIWNLARCGED